MDDLRREIEHTLEEIAYAAVGFAVLGLQRVQVARRQMERCNPSAVLSDQLRGLFEHFAAGNRGESG